MAWQLYVAEFPNGKRYFGITGRLLDERIRDHRDQLRSPSYPVHHALKKYGDDVVFRTLVIGERDYIHDLEIRAIEAFRARNRRFGYNISLGGNLSPMLVPETVKKMRATNTGRKLTPEHKAKLAAAWTPRSRETFKKISDALKGHKKSPEHCAAMSAARKGRKQDPEVVARRAATQRGSKKSDSTRALISAAHKGRAHTPEQIAKFVISRTGVKHTEETKAKMSEAHRGSRRSDETKAKMSAKLVGNARSKGFRHSPESIARRLATRERNRKAANEHSCSNN